VHAAAARRLPRPCCCRFGPRLLLLLLLLLLEVGLSCAFVVPPLTAAADNGMARSCAALAALKAATLSAQRKISGVWRRRIWCRRCR
jgi:hypothetical protein